MDYAGANDKCTQAQVLGGMGYLNYSINQKMFKTFREIENLFDCEVSRLQREAHLSTCT